MDTQQLSIGFDIAGHLVEPAHGRVQGPDGERRLPPRVMRTLLCLARHAGETVERDSLAIDVFGRASVEARRLDQLIDEVRRALGDSGDGEALIEKTADGYRLVAPVSLRSPGATEPDAIQSPTASPRRPLLRELRRRGVFNVAGVYLAGAWLVLQVADVIADPLGMPAWARTFLVILAIVGFPLAIGMAWVFEVTPQGLRREIGDGTVPAHWTSAMPAVGGAVALAFVVLGAFVWLRGVDVISSDPLAPDPLSIAVLPLVDLSPAGDRGYLGDGLADELANQLDRLAGLRVASQTSAFAFKGQSADARTIGATLGVRHLVEGTVRGEGESVHVTAQLIDARTGFREWSGTYQRTIHDLVTIQQDVARAIAQALEVVLTPDVERGMRNDREIDSAAFDRYVAGLAELRRPTAIEQLGRAERLFREALRQEPRFARAHAALCELFTVRYRLGRDPRDVDLAEQSCREALDLDGSLSEVSIALGELYLVSGRYPQALETFERQRRREPLDADVHIGLGRSYEGLGRVEEALAAYARAIEVEPLYWATYAAAGKYHFARGQWTAAIPPFQRVTELAPASTLAWNNLGAAQLMLGKFEESARAYEHSLAILPSRSAYSNTGTLYYYLGRFPEAADMFLRATTLASEDHRMWGNLADACLLIPGRYGEARIHYERAIELAERGLSVNPGEAETRAQLGYYYSRTGQLDRASDEIARALAEGDRVPYVHYYAALVSIERGDPAAAVESLRRSVDLGYPRALLDAAPELAQLRDDPRFVQWRRSLHVADSSVGR
jgi:TolB-like protein/Flp pilus assembly protein TadD/DNA-binding winged helix-turn-helix (wHTH) protein